MEHPHKGKSGIRRIWNALFHSLDGFATAFRLESAFRQEVFLAAVLIPVALILPASGPGKALMIAAVLLVLIVELLNSAVEAAVDRISLENHPLAKRAKDYGSTAVFLSLINVARRLVAGAPRLTSHQSMRVLIIEDDSGDRRQPLRLPGGAGARRGRRGRRRDRACTWRSPAISTPSCSTSGCRAWTARRSAASCATKRSNDTPVLMLTARDTLEDKLEGFARGADDYLVKPFALKEVEARARRPAQAPRGPRRHAAAEPRRPHVRPAPRLTVAFPRQGGQAPAQVHSAAARR